MITVSRTSTIPAALLLLVAFFATACSSSPSELAPAETLVADSKTAEPTIAQTATPSPEFIPIEGGVDIPAAIAPQLDAIQAAVEAIRGYKPGGVVNRQLLPRAKLREHFEAEFQRDELLMEIEIEDRLFKLLGMIDGDLDLIEP